MKRRNPLFVAGFPYAMIFLGYIILNLLSVLGSDGESLPDNAILPILGAIAVILVGVGYDLFWRINTAHTLRRETGKKIPFAILLVIPLANYWWLWRYSEAAEAYTDGKVQTALGFILLALVGPIGNGILQDYYNKTAHKTAH